MKTSRAALAATAVALLGARPYAQPPPSSPAPFRFERPVVAGAGPRRLPIDVPLVAGGRPFRVVGRSLSANGEPRAAAVGGLADLRLLDASGSEVPYLLVPNPESEPVWHEARAILPVAPVETENARTSGFEADLGAAIDIDRFRLDRLPPPYLKRLRLEGSGDREHWTLLLDEATVFDLPDSQLRQTELGFTAGSYRYLRVTWDDARSARVVMPPAASAREVSTTAPPPALTTALVFERRPSEPGRSRFHVRLPGARLPIVWLDFDVAAGHVMRDVEIYEPRLAGGEAAPALLGRGTLKRVEQGPLAATSMSVAMQAPTEPELDIVVDDGNNPPLQLRGIAARFADLPWIYFEADGVSIARYGNATLGGPRYDLEAVRQTLRIESVANGSWGEARIRTDAENEAGAVPPLPTVGAAIDAATFRFVRDLPAGEAGLVAVRLDEAALAHSGSAPSRFRDVRVIDAEGRQVPYLVERLPEPLSVDVTIERPASPPEALGTRPGETVYRIRWPYDRLPAARLVLTTGARVFKRRVAVAVERTPDRRRRDPWVDTLATANWTHAAQETPAPALTIELPETDTRELLVTVAEGDNSVLPIANARLLFPQYRIRFFREPQAALRLAYGRDDLTTPSYDLALLAPRLLGASAVDVPPDPERDAGDVAAVSPISPRLFWAILGGAVLILLGLIVRLMRHQQA